MRGGESVKRMGRMFKDYIVSEVKVAFKRKVRKTVVSIVTNKLKATYKRMLKRRNELVELYNELYGDVGIINY